MLDSNSKAKFAWRCRRGMLELDLILQNFLTKEADKLTEEHLMAFEALLNTPDPQLLAWLMGYENPLEEELIQIVHIIRNCN